MTARTPRLLAGLLIALASASPALAQPDPSDPFEAIVANPDGANTRLDDVTVPVERSLTEDELRQYLEALRVVNLAVSFTMGDASDPANGNLPTIPAVGPFEAPNGTRVDIRAGFEKRPGEREGRLRTLELIPSNPMHFGALRFNRITLGEDGSIDLHINPRLMGITLWPERVSVEKIYRDSEGALVFKMGGNGIGGALAPDMRVTADGRVQRWKRGFLGIGRGWKDLEKDGQPVRVADTIPIDRWPPRTTDLLDWLPSESGEVAGSSPDPDAIAEEFQPYLDAVPISEMSLRFHARADEGAIELSDDRGRLELSDHELTLNSHGRFEGRTYVSDPSLPNDYRATATVTGDLRDPGSGSSVHVDRARVELTGDHSERIPFDDLAAVEMDVDARLRIDAALSDLRANLPAGSYLVAPGATTGSFDGSAELTLRPLTADEDERSELRLARENEYRFSSEGPVHVGGLEEGGVTLPEMTIVASDDPETPEDESRGPVLRGEGTLGARMGFIFTKTEVDLHGETTTPGLVGVLAGEGAEARELRTTLKPGAEVHVYAYAFAGIKEETLEGGGVRLTADARVSGTGEETRVRADGLEADFPGATDVDLRVAGNVRHGTRNGAETIVRGAAAEGSVTLREGEGNVEAGLPGGPVLSGTVGEGTRLAFSTGRLRRADVHDTVLETEGYEDGERAARLEAHLVLTGGSVAHRDLSAAFRGRTTVDLSAALGFRVDPARLAAETGADPSAGAPVSMDLSLGVAFAAGSEVETRTPGGSGTLSLRGATTFTVHGEVKVDAASGAPSLRSLSGVDVTIEAGAADLNAILQPAGRRVSASSGRSSVRLRNVRVDILEDGLEVHHDGLTIEVGAGSFRIGG